MKVMNEFVASRARTYVWGETPRNCASFKSGSAGSARPSPKASMAVWHEPVPGAPGAEVYRGR
jgi:hypothetical protein